MGNGHMAINFKLVISNGYYNLNFYMKFDGNYKLSIIDEDKTTFCFHESCFLDMEIPKPSTNPFWAFWSYDLFS